MLRWFPPSLGLMCELQPSLAFWFQTNRCNWLLPDRNSLLLFHGGSVDWYSWNPSSSQVRVADAIHLRCQWISLRQFVSLLENEITVEISACGGIESQMDSKLTTSMKTKETDWMVIAMLFLPDFFRATNFPGKIDFRMVSTWLNSSSDFS
jgi:hypothetical protein